MATSPILVSDSVVHRNISKFQTNTAWHKWDWHPHRIRIINKWSEFLLWLCVPYTIKSKLIKMSAMKEERRRQSSVVVTNWKGFIILCMRPLFDRIPRVIFVYVCAAFGLMHGNSIPTPNSYLIIFSTCFACVEEGWVANIDLIQQLKRALKKEPLVFVVWIKKNFRDDQQ